MGLLIDLHVHTRLYSRCSFIEPESVIPQAIKAGLDGLVITEHGYQWSPDELATLAARSGNHHFLVLAGFEYTSTQGDVLIYGLSTAQARAFPPGMPPEEAVRRAHEYKAICIAAHPTRAGMGFDERIATLNLDAIEVRSMNLKEHEQRLAQHLATSLGLRPVAASDAHQPQHIGRYATEFDFPVLGIADLQDAFRHGTFRPADTLRKRTDPLE